MKKTALALASAAVLISGCSGDADAPGNPLEIVNQLFPDKPVDADDAGIIISADGSDHPSPALYKLDYTTGAATKLVDLTNTITAMAINSSCELFAIAGSDAIPENEVLYKIDANGSLNKIADMSGDGTTIPDITFVGSTLYAWTESGDDFGSIDTSTGVFTEINASDLNTWGSGMASIGGTIYFAGTGIGSDPNDDFQPIGSRSVLTKITPATGAEVNDTPLFSSSIPDSDATLNDFKMHAMSNFGGRLIGIAEVEGDPDQPEGYNEYNTLVEVDVTSGDLKIDRALLQTESDGGAFSLDSLEVIPPSCAGNFNFL